MKAYKSIDVWTEPAEEIRKKDGFVGEMSLADHEFLSGAIRMKAPKKLVEVGVAGGGTTAVIMNAIRKSKLKCEVTSVDVSERYYRDSNKSTGFFYENNKKLFDNHRFILGKTIAGAVEDIGENIDMAIIDTTHSMPGEFLDFLAIYPYLSEEALVILHDVNLNQLPYNEITWQRATYRQSAFATKALMGVVKGKKFLNFSAFEKNGGVDDILFPNIGAFQITNDTKDSIIDIFWMLSMTWAYMPSYNQMQEYRDIITKYYDEDCIALFEKSLELNKASRDRFFRAKQTIGDEVVKLL